MPFSVPRLSGLSVYNLFVVFIMALVFRLCRNGCNVSWGNKHANEG